MKVYQTNEIRNIVLIGGAKSGKTTLGEAMLFEGGVITRRGSVEDKNTVSDYREIELERQNSISSTVLYSEFEGKKINIIDAPGFDDFAGEMVAALHVCDTALMLVNAQNGVEVGTEITWRYTTKHKSPVVFIMNQLDHEKANFDEGIRQLKQYFGDKVIPVQYPLTTGTAFNSVIDVLKMKMYKFTPGSAKAEITDIPEAEKAKAAELHGKIVEAAAESDEKLMEKFFEEGSLSEEELLRGLKQSIMKREVYPLLCVSAKQDTGVARLMQFINEFIPAPNEMPCRKTTEGKDLKCSTTEPASAYVFKTTLEQHLGQMTFFKLYNGEIAEGMDMVNANTGSKERLSQLFIVAGKNRVKIEKVVAGDIAATIKLKDAHTCNTLDTPKNSNDIVTPVEYPEPKFRTAIRAKNQSDDEKLGGILKSAHEEDPTIIFEQSMELKQAILQGQGELQLTVLKWKIENLDKIEIEYYPCKIPYRETITKPAKSSYRHKKQSGGAGQFGEVYMMIEPWYEGKPDQKEFPIRGRDEINLNWGGKLFFHNCIVGGAIDARFMPAILKGIMEKIEEGPLTGSYARDIVVSVYDGKMHPVDSNEISFKLAGRNAFKEAFKNAGPKILEPIYEVEVVMPSERMGDVMTDLQGRRAIVLGMDSEGNYQKIKARVPLAELNRYSTSLSSITSGRATYGMKFADYQQVPGDVQEQLLKAYEAESKDEE
ncbi:MAG TPA: elongation factor G [Bacteroidales bacterium]|nr:elongation factor G [Bacteroidales bacterium]HPS17275.1 elongation factor G [Bacteroidales bacterium]